MVIKANKNQKYSSKNTSIKYSSGRLPRTYSLDIPAGSTVLDYGCGKYMDYLKEAAEERGWKWIGYDPYNGVDNIDIDVNDYVICSNVLNVIKEDEIVNEVIRNCMALAKVAVYFSIYDKDRDGNGKESGDDKWQRNEKIDVYVERICNLGFNAKKVNGMIVATVA